MLNTVNSNRAGLKDGEPPGFSEVDLYVEDRLDERRKANLKALAKSEGTGLERLYEEQDWLGTDSSENRPHSLNGWRSAWRHEARNLSKALRREAWS